MHMHVGTNFGGENEVHATETDSVLFRGPATPSSLWIIVQHCLQPGGEEHFKIPTGREGRETTLNVVENFHEEMSLGCLGLCFPRKNFLHCLLWNESWLDRGEENSLYLWCFSLSLSLSPLPPPPPLHFFFEELTGLTSITRSHSCEFSIFCKFPHIVRIWGSVTRRRREKKGNKGVGGGGGGGKPDWRPEIEVGTSALENLRKCHKNNSNNNKVILGPCELQ